MRLTMLPGIAEVEEAALRLREWLNVTPTLESQWLDERLGRRVLVKAECLQQGGSFKIRGALNRLLSLSQAERARGVVAFSSGNHAQAVSLAGHWLDTPVTIVMPRDAPEVKIRATRAWGAEIRYYDRAREDRERIAARIAEERGAALVPPFDHPHIVAGQGTVGLELAEAARVRGMTLGTVYVPCGGGGLIAGSAIALKTRFPECRVIAVEPEAYDDTRRSLASGEREVVAGHPATICDGLMAPMPGAITFALNRRLLDSAVTVSDAEVRRAMAYAFRHLKLVVEPSGAVALAAALSAAPDDSKALAVVVSGANVDAELLWAAVSEFSDP